MKKESSLFAGLQAGWLELTADCRAEIVCDGKKLDLVWENSGKDRFSAELPFGILTLEIVSMSDGLRIGSSLELTGTLPENVIFTPLSTWWTAALTGENPFTAQKAAQEPLVNNYVVQIGTMLINFVTEFLYQKFVVYRKTIDTNERARKAEKQDE